MWFSANGRVLTLNSVFRALLCIQTKRGKGALTLHVISDFLFRDQIDFTLPSASFMHFERELNIAVPDPICALNRDIIATVQHYTYH